MITSVDGTFFSLKRKGLKGVKTNGTKNSLKAGTRLLNISLRYLRAGLLLIVFLKRLFYMGLRIVVRT
jgi:hypothetical protein